MKNDLDLNSLLLVQALAASGSFTAAAERLGSSKTKISLQIKALEQQLGVALFRRTTRQVSLTAEGALLVERCLPLLDELRDELQQLQLRTQTAVELSGTLVISAPEDYSNRVLVPLLLQFQRLHPKLQLDLRSSDQVQDLIKQGIDLSIRIGWLQDSSLKAQRLGDFAQWLLAAPAYLEKFAPPQQPDDLKTMNLIAFTLLPTPQQWRFTQGNQLMDLRLPSNIKTSSTQTVTSLLLHGAGLGVLPDYSAKTMLQQGLLQRVLPEWQLPGGGIYAVYPPGPHRPAKVRQFVAFLQQYLAAV
ncbi:LysR family transcriptional regulator [Rheinheimera riviphila]|uniref:LysR family transcriptional regulator n=1 Tax=Rheinheimera riviphila TaxID=1834037 RepID=A0A437QFM6_9GAMM|nr:substrate binding domain-containing protein [Rheinheimera riviphila]RVU33345.1 LysR family transcriptional regulator [Rheinheimera riviphila]